MNHETSWNYQCAAICDKLQKKSGKLLTRILDANLLNSLEGIRFERPQVVAPRA